MRTRETTACFTGHRKVRGQAADITDRITETIERLVQTGYRTFCAGGARGFDAIASETVLALQAKYPQIQLLLMLPFAGQYRYEKGWSRADIEQYYRLQEKAAQTIILAPDYRPGMYYRRNRALVDASSVCIAYMTRKNSGTGYTVRYAQEKGLQVLNLAEPIAKSYGILYNQAMRSIHD